MKITTNELQNMIAEEVAFVQERFMSGKFRKAIEKYQELQVQQQKLQKAFVGTKDTKKREKLKAALVVISKKVKAAEADFNRALHVEPVDMYEGEVNEAFDVSKLTGKTIDAFKKHVIKKGEVKGTYAGRPVILKTNGNKDIGKWTVTFLKTKKTAPFVDAMANLKIEGKLNEDDDKYNSYSYQGDNLVAAITPAENFDDKYKGQMALVITDVMSSIARVFLVAPEKEFISKAGKLTKGNVKQGVEKAKKNGLSNIYMPKKIYDKLDDVGFKNKKKYGASMIQTHSLKPVKK